LKPIRYALAALAITASAVFFVHCGDDGGRNDSSMGGGVGLLDIDGDRDLDLFLSGGNGNGRLFENRDGRFHQRPFPATSAGRFAMGVASGDVDNDGDVDLFLTHLGPDQLLLNDGLGNFTDQTKEAGIEIDGWSTSATFFDANRDGWLDLFVGRYVRHNDAERCTDASGRQDYCGPSVFAPESDSLWINSGDGSFVDATDLLGIGRGIGAALGVVAFDANGDRRPDLFVANDGDPNHLWIQQPDGRFEDEALLRGVAYNHAGEAEAGMGVVAAQLSSESEIDLFVTHLAAETHTLYEAATGRFKDVSGERQLAEPSRAFTGFGVIAIDEEFDGDLDLWVANGRVAGGPVAEQLTQRYAEMNQRFVQQSDRLRFEPSGLTSVEPGVSRGMTHGDLDADGDDDVVIVNLDMPTEIWINEAERKGDWIAIEAWLPDQRRHALGARVELETSQGRRVAIINRGSSYLSSKPPIARFGLGAAQIESIVVQWPDGVRERFNDLTAQQTHRLNRGQGDPE
jgi:hypothetical protein